MNTTTMKNKVTMPESLDNNMSDTASEVLFLVKTCVAISAIVVLLTSAWV